MTEPAEHPTPRAPLLIEQLLGKLGVPFQLADSTCGLPAVSRLQAVLLDDAVGALLVLFSQDQLLDLKRLA